MTTNEKVNSSNEAMNNPEATQQVNDAAEAMQMPEPEPKKGWLSRLGTAAKIGIGVAVGGIAVGATWLLTALLGGKDDESEDETTPVIGDGTDDVPTD